jgi:hypothetical protein
MYGDVQNLYLVPKGILQFAFLAVASVREKGLRVLGATSRRLPKAIQIESLRKPLRLELPDQSTNT